MNNWHVAGQSIGLYVEFKKDGEYMPPDAGSIRLTIRDSTGVPFVNFNQALQPDISLTSELVTIPPEVNTINEGVENRFVRVDYRVGGVPCDWLSNYKLTPFVPMTALPSDVRNALGVRESELSDPAVDLYDGYYRLEAAYAGLDEALVSTNPVMASSANRAIVLTVALMLLPSMPQRVMKQDQLHSANVIRQTIDWDSLKAAIVGELADCIQSFSLVTNSYGAPVLFTTSLPQDPVTLCLSSPRRYLEFTRGLTGLSSWGT